MLEIFLILIGIIIPIGLLAKHIKRRRGSGLVVINIDMAVTLATLANQTVIVDSPAANELFSRSLYVISSDLYVTLRGATAGEGPIEVGWAHSDLSTGEIAEGILADTSNRNDQIALEQAGRKIRKIGMFGNLGTNEVLNDGKDVRTKIRFMVDTGNGLALYAFNRSGSALTTGQVVIITGKIYCRRA